MHEDFFHALLHLRLAPIRVLLAKAGSLEPSRPPIKLEGRAQLLRPAHLAERGDVFGREFRGHDDMYHDEYETGKDQASPYFNS